IEGVNARGESRAQGIRPSPSPRLSWPARDSQGTGSWPTEEDMDKSKSKLSGEETIFPGNATSGAPLGGPPDDERTRLFKAPRVEPGPASSTEASAAAETPPAHEISSKNVVPDDPVVGWFVVVDGPGKGRSIEIGIGANSIGRDRGQKVCLSF